MRAKKDSTARLSDQISGTSPLRFHTNRRNFHAILASLGRCFEGRTDHIGTSEIGLALLFILVEDGEVAWVNDSPPNIILLNHAQLNSRAAEARFSFACRVFP
jgi:hypothetical protein